MRPPLPWHEKTNTLHVPFHDSSGISNGLPGAGLLTQQSGFMGRWPKRQLSRPACLAGIHVTPLELQESFSPVLFSNLTQAQEHAVLSLLLMQLRHQVPTLVFLLPQTCLMLMRDFLGKILFFSRHPLTFYGDHCHFPPVQRPQRFTTSFFPLIIGKGICTEEGGYCHVVAVGKDSATSNKCEEVYRLKCQQFWNSFRMPGPQPSTWVLVANWGITGKDPTKA